MASCQRIVFLIDENISTDSHESIISNIHLACLRILSFYAYSSTNCTDIKNSLMWGYKLYNSKEKQKSFRYKQLPFYEYKVASFDQFEKDLYEKLEYERDNKSEQTKLKEKAYAGEQLRVALTDLLADYHWDRPELFSPAKKSSHIQHEQTTQNQVFLFTNTPNDIPSYFKEENSNFIKLLLPDMVRDKFCCRYNICLCWIDTVNGKIENQDCYDILSDNLKQINGQLIELSSISSWWLNCHGNQIKHSGLVSSSSMLKALLPNKTQTQRDSKQDSSLKMFNLPFYNKDDNDNECFVTIISSSANQFTSLLSNNNEEKKLSVKHIQKQSEINIMCLQEHFQPCFYIMKSMNNDMMKHIISTKSALVTEFVIGSTSTTSYMIPYTYGMGVLLFVKTQTESNACKEVEELSRDTEQRDVERLLEESIETNIGTSLVNIIDPWFLTNQHLGFPRATKDCLKKFYDDEINNETKREENSKQIINFIKKKFKKIKEDEIERKKSNLKSLPLKKKNNMKGITWARWRLLEYEKKKEEQLNNNNNNKMATTEETQQGVDAIVPIEEEIIDDIKDFSSEEELIAWCKMVYNEAVQTMNMCHCDVSRIIQTVENYFMKRNDSYKDNCVDFILSHLLLSVVNIKEKYNVETQKQDLVNNHLLQILLICNSVLHFTQNDDEIDDRFLTKVVALFRSLTFVESSSYVRQYLQATLLPRYAHKTADFMRGIYDDLMINLPDILDNEVDESKIKDESPVKSVQPLSSIGCSYYDSDMSSVGSMTSDRTTTLRRHSSFVGDNVNKKTIAVTAKATKKKKKKKDGYKSISEITFNQPKQPVTPKANRRKSEPQRRIVPDTPEAKQINDLIWKKQDRERRHSLVNKKMKPIEESPLKDITSPIKRKSLYRSNSFQSTTSPRRFYANKKRHPSMLVGLTKFSLDDANNLQPANFRRHNTIGGIERQNFFPSHTLDASAFNSKILDNDVFDNKTVDSSAFDSQTFDTLLAEKSLVRRKSTLLLNFEREVESERNCTIEKKDSGLDFFSGSFDKQLIQGDEKMKSCRKNIFTSRISSSATSGTGSSFDSLSSGSMKRKLSSFDQSVKKQRLSNDDSEHENIMQTENVFTFKMFGKNNEVDDAEQSRQTEPMRRKVEPVNKFVSANTTDWLSLIEKEQNESPKTFRTAFEDLAKTPTGRIKYSPTIVKAGENSITVSPCLSASSLKLLEKAPILSPDLLSGKRKSKRRKQLETEY